MWFGCGSVIDGWYEKNQWDCANHGVRVADLFHRNIVQITFMDPERGVSYWNEALCRSAHQTVGRLNISAKKNVPRRLFIKKNRFDFSSNTIAQQYLAPHSWCLSLQRFRMGAILKILPSLWMAIPWSYASDRIASVCAVYFFDIFKITIQYTSRRGEGGGQPVDGAVGVAVLQCTEKHLSQTRVRRSPDGTAWIVRLFFHQYFEHEAFRAALLLGDKQVFGVASLLAK